MVARSLLANGVKELNIQQPTSKECPISKASGRHSQNARSHFTTKDAKSSEDEPPFVFFVLFVVKILPVR